MERLTKCQIEIKKLRESTGMNRKEFCECFNIPYRTVTEWERGTRNAPDYVLRLLAYYIRMENMLKEKEEGYVEEQNYTPGEAINKKYPSSELFMEAGHPGGSLSAADIFTYLYFEEMNIDTKNPKDSNRDRFVLSKGHTAPGYYAALANRGYFPIEDLRRTSFWLCGNYCHAYRQNKRQIIQAAKACQLAICASIRPCQHNSPLRILLYRNVAQ